MKILYIGDIMGEAGIEVIENLLPSLKTELNLDLVIAQAENTTAGKGISLSDCLYIGDIMGEAGIEVIENLLPSLKTELNLDLVIAQAENTTAGKGISLSCLLYTSPSPR